MRRSDDAHHRAGHRARSRIGPAAGSRPSASRPGLTNTNYRVDGRRHAVLRADPRRRDGPARRRPRRTSCTTRAPRPRPASAPRSLHALPDWDVFVLEWLAGRTMSNEAFGAPGMPTRIAETLRRLHAGPRFRDDFDMFRLAERYLARRRRARDRRSRTGTASASTGCPRSRRPWPSTRWRPSRATTTCSPRTTSTTARGCGSSTTSTAATTTRPSSSATRARSWASTTARIARAVRAPTSARRPPRLLARMRLQMIMSDVGWTLWAAIQARDLDDRLRLLGLGRGALGAGAARCSTARTSRTGWPRSAPDGRDRASAAAPSPHPRARRVDEDVGGDVAGTRSSNTSTLSGVPSARSGRR